MDIIKPVSPVLFTWINVHLLHVIETSHGHQCKPKEVGRTSTLRAGSLDGSGADQTRNDEDDLEQWRAYEPRCKLRTACEMNNHLGNQLCTENCSTASKPGAWILVAWKGSGMPTSRHADGFRTGCEERQQGPKPSLGGGPPGWEAAAAAPWCVVPPAAPTSTFSDRVDWVQNSRTQLFLSTK